MNSESSTPNEPLSTQLPTPGLRRNHGPMTDSTVTLVDTISVNVATFDASTTLVDLSVTLENPSKSEESKSNNYLTGYKLIVTIGSFMIMIALDGLDQMVLSTSLVAITSQFGAVSDIAWITSILPLVQASIILICGKILNIAPPKTVLLVSAGLFELGSLLCAAAPTINVLILGRAVAGLGVGGLWTSVLSTVGRIAPLHQRALLMSLISSAFGFTSSVGPIIGGLLSERVSWRWCFYINLPAGCLGMFFIFIFMPNLPSLTVHEKSALDTWLKLDWIGTFLSISGVFLFLTGLQLGGAIKPWNDPAVIVTIVLGIIVFSLFIIWERRAGPAAILPLSMLTKKTLVGSYILSALMHWAMVVITIYLPILYQLRGHSIIRSSIETLPLIGSGVAAGIISGVLVAKTGIAWFWLFYPPFLGTMGFALLSVSNVDMNLGYIAGCQILVGFSLGASVQHTVVVVQAEFADREDLIPQATSLISFFSSLFSAVGTAVAGAVFSAALHTEVDKLHLPLSEPLKSLVFESIDAVLAIPQEALREPLIDAYTTSTCRAMLTGAIVTALGGLSALLITRKRIPKS